MKHNTLAIVGATGMLGHHTAVAAMKMGFSVRAIQRESSDVRRLEYLGIEVARADFSQKQSIIQALTQVDAVIHCAAYYPVLPKKWRDDVKAGVSQMDLFYQACEQVDLQKIVYLGGAIALKKVTGRAARESDEYDSQPANKNPYLQVKWALDVQAKEQARIGLPVVIGIPSMTFGEFDYAPTTGGFITEIANGNVRNFVHGLRNVVYAGDAGTGLTLCAMKGEPGERYFITGENTSMEEITRTIAALAKVPQPKAVPLFMARLLSKLQIAKYHCGGPAPILSETAIAIMSAGQHLDGIKAMDQLGYRPTLSASEAVARAYVWFVEKGMI